MKPVFRTFDIEVPSIDAFTFTLKTQVDPLDHYSVSEHKKYTPPVSEDQTPKYKMVKCEILYNNNEVMTVGFGNSKKQAERNASIQGQIWLHQNKGDQLLSE
jgi:hypothetical protein